MTLISAGIVSADNTCNVCTENCTPCGGGCTATDMTMMYAGASNWSAIGNISGWNTSCVTNMNYMFYNSNFNQDISSWNTSRVTNMNGMFGYSKFNQDISAWDVSSVTDMGNMFQDDIYFNQSINKWDIRNVNNFYYMFAGATSFNQPLNNWDTSSITNMNGMFASATSFNQNISNWNTSRVTNMNYMFYNAGEFNQDISMWDVTSVVQMYNMFYGDTLSTYNYDSLLNGWSTENIQSEVTFSGGHSKYSSTGEVGHDILTGNPYNWDINDGGLEVSSCSICNESCSPCGGGCIATDLSEMFQNVTDFDFVVGDITQWNTSCITNMSGMFENSDFNQNIGAWDTSSVTDMNSMFEGASTFNQHLNSWNTSKVTNMSNMFFEASSFDGNVDMWDVSSVTDMADMFNGAYAFVDYIHGWNTSSVTDMHSMFKDATSFATIDISQWDVSSVTDMADMFNGANTFNSNISSWDTSSVTKMNGMFEEAYAFNSDISGWDTSNVTDMSYMFYNSNFNQPINSWNTSNVIDMANMFSFNSAFNQPLDSWNVSSVNSMNSMFFNANAFDQDISSWNTGNVTDMSGFLAGTAMSVNHYNSLLNGWANKSQQYGTTFESSSQYSIDGKSGKDILTNNYGWNIYDGGRITCDICSEWCAPCSGDCTATDMTQMFAGVSDWSSVGNISGWNTSCITSMDSMFEGASNFNQDINSWDVSSVTDMNNMFSTSDFNSNISSWNTSSVIEMTGMFDTAVAFDQDINSWDTSKVTTMRYMFTGATSFNHPLDSWDVSLVTSMEGMFLGATSFNQNISSWNTSNVNNMNYMFDGASAFNGDVSSWNISNVTDTSSMFYNAGSFNQSLDQWDTSSVTNMAYMFQGDTAFDQNLSSWNITNVHGMDSMFTDVTLSTPNYDSLLNSWANQAVQNDVPFSGGNSIYSNGGKIGRNILANNYSWIITDGGQESCDVCNETCSPCGGGCTTTDMTMMYAGVTDWSSIGNITGWNTSCITAMAGMFYQSNFNQDIGNWNVSNVTDIDSMFSKSSFNQSLSKWDTSSVTNMGYMFDGDTAFDQNLSSWNMQNVQVVDGMFHDVTLSVNNYDALLNGWSNETVNSGFYGAVFDGGNSQYSVNGLSGRYLLANTYEWNITDGGYYYIAENIPPPKSGSSSGSNGGSSSGGVQCIERWKCNAWSACSKYGLRIRTCTDLSACGTTTTKPSISEVCNQKEYNTTLKSPKKALFDILTDIVTEPKKSGEDLVVKISLINFGLKGTVNANLSYKILDNESTLVKQFNETVPVSTQTEFLKHINTSGLLKGKYTLIIDLTYPGQIDPANTEKIFNIGGGFFQDLLGLFRNAGLDAILISAIITGLLVFIYVRSRRNAFKKNEDLSLKTIASNDAHNGSRIRPGNESDVHEHVAQNLKVIAMYNREIKSLIEINQSLEKHGFVESAEKNEKTREEKKKELMKVDNEKENTGNQKENAGNQKEKIANQNKHALAKHKR